MKIVENLKVAIENYRYHILFDSILKYTQCKLNGPHCKYTIRDTIDDCISEIKLTWYSRKIGIDWKYRVKYNTRSIIRALELFVSNLRYLTIHKVTWKDIYYAIYKQLGYPITEIDQLWDYDKNSKEKNNLGKITFEDFLNKLDTIQPDDISMTSRFIYECTLYYWASYDRTLYENVE